MSCASSAITVVSPPNAAGAVAITVREPPSVMLRAAGIAVPPPYPIAMLSAIVVENRNASCGA